MADIIEVPGVALSECLHSVSQRSHFQEMSPRTDGCAQQGFMLCAQSHASRGVLGTDTILRENVLELSSQNAIENSSF